MAETKGINEAFLISMSITLFTTIIQLLGKIEFINKNYEFFLIATCIHIILMISFFLIIYPETIFLKKRKEISKELKFWTYFIVSAFISILYLIILI